MYGSHVYLLFLMLFSVLLAPFKLDEVWRGASVFVPDKGIYIYGMCSSIASSLLGTKYVTGGFAAQSSGEMELIVSRTSILMGCRIERYDVDTFFKHERPSISRRVYCNSKRGAIRCRCSVLY